MYNLIDAVFNNNKIVCKLMDITSYDITYINIKTNHRNDDLKVTCDCCCNRNVKTKQSTFFIFLQKYIFKKCKTSYCHHIKWFGVKYMRQSYPEYWDIDTLNTFKRLHIDIYKNHKIGRNEDCYICFEYIDCKNENTLYCNNCKHIVHRFCMNKYLSMNRKYNTKLICCLCGYKHQKKRNNYN